MMDDVLRILDFASKRNGRWLTTASFANALGIPRKLVTHHMRRDDFTEMAEGYRYDYRIRNGPAWMASCGTYSSWWLAAVWRGYG